LIRDRLRHFEDVLPDEFKAINARRSETNGARPVSLQRHDIDRLEPKEPPIELRAPQSGLSRKPSPDPNKLFRPRSDQGCGGGLPPEVSPHANPENPDHDKTRPRPVPCDATGLAFSGGGIRSAAVCLGALQALHRHRRIDWIDYLSTVSGGGYIGCCLSAAMSNRGGRTFPFGDHVSDSTTVAHLRNYSNYLMPRGRSGIRNVSDAAAVILRGLLANTTLVLATLLLCALVTKAVFFRGVVLLPDYPHHHTFRITLWFLAAVVVVLILWAVLRSNNWFDSYTDDTRSCALAVARVTIVVSVIAAFLDLQPFAIEHRIHEFVVQNALGIFVSAVPIAFSIAISFMSSSLGRFLLTSQHTKDWRTFARRGATHFMVFLAAMVLPAALWIAYLYLSAWIIDVVYLLDDPWPSWVGRRVDVQLYLKVFVVLTVIAIFLTANGYSLHRFYRDRLSRAFLFRPANREALDNLKLSELNCGAAPYHIVNAAMNVQGSTEANRRGRNADFFMFTRNYVGSDLTLFAPTPVMETIDQRLDFATAMAISGAAVSANMGTQTVRLLSPTLALLNVRLGYWLRNPRDLAKDQNFGGRVYDISSRLIEKFYLLLEMFNQLDETSRNVYLSDGGHIENLGIYELLKRGCQLIVVVDAEADPSMSFGSLMKPERYARIDFGVRIILPCEEIAQKTKSVSDTMEHGTQMCCSGPHCSVGRIFYENGAEGIILYFKSSLTGDEKDYILDYKKRYAAFPHETTGDQFFSEEQFEVYRALGFHMVDRFFDGTDKFSFLSNGRGAFTSQAVAFAAVMAMLPEVP
jgi:hypothetical protein